MKYPMLALAGSFALGIMLVEQGHRPASALILPVALGGAALCLLAGLILLRRDAPRSSLALALAGFVLAGAAAAGLFPFRFAPDHVSRMLETARAPQAPIELEGRVISTPLQTGSELQMDIDATRLDAGAGSRPATGKVRLWMDPSIEIQRGDGVMSRLEAGDTVRARVLLRRPRLYRNPGGFDFRQRLASIDDLYWDGAVEEIERAESPGNQWRLAPGRFVEHIRARLRDGIDRLYPPWSREGRDGAVLKAVLLGDRSSLDSATIESFRKSGLYHLLVVAGLHVGLVALLATGLFRLLGFARRTRTLLLLVFLLGYALLVEQRAPTLRATVMIVAFLVAGLLDREHRALNAVGIAALALLVSRPAWLWESGFQLSFAAALLIAGVAAPLLARSTESYRRALRELQSLDRDPLLAPRLAQFRLDLRSLVGWAGTRLKVLDRHPRVAEGAVILPVRLALWTVNIVLFSAVLQIGLLLPMAETFHRVTLAGIGLNAVAVPVMTLLLAVAFPTMALAAFAPALAVAPAKLVAVVLHLLFALTQVPHLPAWLSYRVPPPPGWVAWGFALSVIAAALLIGRSRWMLGAAGVVFAGFAALVALYPFAPRLAGGFVEVTALDCGGGDATFIVLPDRTTVLEGGCGGQGGWQSAEGGFRARPWDPGEAIVSPYLWSRGIKKIDVLVVADAHGNHLSGIASILANFRVGELWHAPLESDGRWPETLDPRWSEILETADARRTRVVEMAAGRSAEPGGSRLDVLWPPHRDPPWNRDDDSLALRLGAAANSVLLPGDISASAETQLVKSEAQFQSTVLKVGHEGARSAFSPEFLLRVAPRVAIIAAPGGKRFPNPDVLRDLEAGGVRVLRTDADGAVTVRMTGNEVRVTTAAAPQWTSLSRPRDRAAR